MRKKGYRRRDRGYKVRLDALRLAAATLEVRPGDSTCPQLWSLAVFYESYLVDGCAGTRRDFGPKPARKLKVAKR